MEAVKMTESQRAAFAPSAPFNMKDFIEHTAVFVRSHPQLAERAYTGAATRVRYEAQRPENYRARLQFQVIANKLETMASEARVPATDWESGEEFRTFADNVGPYPTEYDAVVASIGASKVAPDGTPNSELMAAHQQQQMFEKMEQGDAIQTRITPASFIPGVSMGGNQALVLFGGSNSTTGSFTSRTSAATSGAVPALQEAQVVRWDGRESECQVVTVAVARALLGAGATFPNGLDAIGNRLNYRPYFHVLWGTSRAQPNEAYGDVGRGMQFNVACSYLYVNVGMSSPLSYGYTYSADSGTSTASVQGLPGSMVLSGQMGFFAAGRTTKTQCTIFVDQLGTGNSTTAIVIPQFATELLPIQSSEVTNGACTITWRQANGSTIMTSQLILPGSQVAPIPLPTDAYDFILTNNGLTATASFRLIFGLSL